jgi:hypothetical protein
MADIYQQGIMLPAPLAGQLPKTQFGIAQLWFVNRTPLFSRFPKLPVGNISFNMVGYRFRPRTLTLTATIGAGDTTFTVSDASILMNGDVLQLSTGEAVEITAAPNTANNTISVRRGIGTAQTIGPGGPSPVAATAIASLTAPANLVTNLGNSRTGGEINQLAISQIPSSVTQYVQTFQHVVQVAGVMQDIQGFPWPGPTPAPFPKNKLDAMQNLFDDVENTALYGVGEALVPGGNSRPKMYGITNLLVTNNKVATNASAYKPQDFLKDAIQPIRSQGGRPSVILASTDFLTGLATWGMPAQLISPGENGFGVPIDVFYSPFIGPIPIVEEMWLAAGSCLVLTGEEVRWRVLKDPVYQPYGRRGDTGDYDSNGEGDWIGRLAIEVDQEAHHAYIHGISGYAPAA